MQLNRTLRYNEVSTLGKTEFYYLQKHKMICIVMIFYLGFENSTQHIAVHTILVKIIFFVFNKTSFVVNKLHIVTVSVAAVQSCHSTSM